MIYRMQENIINYIYDQGLGLVSELSEDLSQLNTKRTNYSIIKCKSRIITSVDEDVKNSKFLHTLQVGMKNVQTTLKNSWPITQMIKHRSTGLSRNYIPRYITRRIENSQL